MKVVVAGRDKSCFALVAKSLDKQNSLPLSSLSFAENAKDVMRIIQQKKTALLIWDIEGQEEQAWTTIRNLKTDKPQIKVVIINKCLDANSVRAALHYDVDDYLIKPVTQKEIIDSLLGIYFDCIKSPNTYNSVDLALKYMQENCTLPITLEDVAKKCFISSCYLSRLIKAKTGKTFVQNLRDMRLTLAEWKLLNTNQSVRTIAKSVGFSNDSYFTYVFRNEKGVTPTVFRRINVQSYDEGKTCLPNSSKKTEQNKKGKEAYEHFDKYTIWSNYERRIEKSNSDKINGEKF